MATSGTTTFNLDLAEILEEAFERTGGEMRSGYDFKTARRTLNILLSEWASQGVNLWTVDQGTQVLTPGVATYDLPADTVDLIDHTIRTNASQQSNQADLTISRISVSTYSSIPNKLTQARPIQLFIERHNTPRFTVWPVPDSAQTYTLVYWRLRRIQDAGNGTNTMDVPFRFVPALIAGLASKLALKVPGGLERFQLLDQQYKEAWEIAAGEDRDRSAVRLVPRQSFV